MLSITNLFLLIYVDYFNNIEDISLLTSVRIPTVQIILYTVMSINVRLI